MIKDFDIWFWFWLKTFVILLKIFYLYHFKKDS